MIPVFNLTNRFFGLEGLKIGHLFGKRDKWGRPVFGPAVVEMSPIPKDDKNLSLSPFWFLRHILLQLGYSGPIHVGRFDGGR